MLPCIIHTLGGRKDLRQMTGTLLPGLIAFTWLTWVGLTGIDAVLGDRIYTKRHLHSKSAVVPAKPARKLELSV